MRRWTITDRQGREIYITEERWEHILAKHFELEGLFEDVLTTIRLGKRKQSRLHPQTFLYSRQSDKLPTPYTQIVVCVAFRLSHRIATSQPEVNNFVTTAWGAVAPE